MKQIFFILFSCLIAFNANAVDGDFRTTDEILRREPDSTPCATEIFQRALEQTAHTVSEYESDDAVIHQWIQSVFYDADVLTAVLDCPEFANLEPDDTIRLQPIEYTFPGGRTITVNYETQPQILMQRITLAKKRDLSKLTDPSPEIGGADDKSLWTNVDPAWYAIMVVQHGALDNFAGDDKNNTISLQYIYDHIDEMYPRGAMCTDKSAKAGDNKAINRATREMVDLKDDTNDYYVAGDANLQWISYAEIAVDVIITVATMGTGEVIAGVAKSARATRVLNNLRKTIKTLSKSEKVIEYVQKTQKLGKVERTLERMKRFKQLEKEISTLDKVKDAEKIAEFEKLGKELREVDKITDTAKVGDKITDLEKETKNITKEMEKLAREEKDVKEYLKARNSYSEIQAYRRAYKNFDRLLKTKQTGNIVARTKQAYKTLKAGSKALKAVHTGTQTMNRGARIARSSMKSGRIRDMLFNSTMKNLATISRFEAQAGALYGIAKFALDMYDWTETSTGKYTNGVDFKPFLLLSADDLEGQENEVNHGMWLLWSGGSTKPEDDDAAYLQAMDFAEKFHTSLVDTMEEMGSRPCDVDIYVVRPILRNPDTETPELYYLIMNDVPWTTAE